MCAKCNHPRLGHDPVSARCRHNKCNCGITQSDIDYLNRKHYTSRGVSIEGYDNWLLASNRTLAGAFCIIILSIAGLLIYLGVLIYTENFDIILNSQRRENTWMGIPFLLAAFLVGVGLYGIRVLSRKNSDRARKAE